MFNLFSLFRRQGGQSPGAELAPGTLRGFVVAGHTQSNTSLVAVVFTATKEHRP